MKNLIVPMAGKSSRFPGVRPKWMLTHPNGNFMVLKAISGLNLSTFHKIYFVFLDEHEEEYHFSKALTSEIEKMGLVNKVHLVSLKEETKSQPETVYQAIIQADIKGQIFIKDSDNYFISDVPDGNFLCVHDLNKCGLINPSNKSYVIINEDNIVNNIIEKKVISPFFCVGGYGFSDSSVFVNTFLQFQNEKDLFISNLVYDCILKGHLFTAFKVQDYRDWGTLSDWNAYKRTYATLFVDFDGIIVYNAAAHFPPYYGETDIISENVEILKELRSSGKFEIVITTSRKEEYREITIKQLKQVGLTFDHLIMNLQHSRRIIINDYSISNPYKSCDSINLKRNSTDLKEVLRESLGVDYSEI